LTVDKGNGNANQVVSGNFADKEQIRLLGSDIRYNKNAAKFKKEPALIYGQTWFWMYYALLFLLFATLMYVFRKRAKESADIVRMKTKRASKVAVKRLKKAASYLKANNQEAFYDEVLKALWGYTSDKLNIPMSRLTKETVDGELAALKVDESIRNTYKEILQECEYARYAPDTTHQAMDKLYQKALQVMNQMENTIKI
jgi:hypothetical protein